MKKHLLFAAMLAMGVAPAVATTPAAPYYAAAEEGSTTTLDEAYAALQKAIEEAIAKIDDTSKEIAAKYPDSYVLESLEYNKGLIQDIATEAASKKEAGTLTVEDVQSYQTQVGEYAQVVEGAVEQATQEEYQALVSQHYMAANDSVNKAMEMPETVANYYYSSVDALYEAMTTIFNNSFSASTAEEYQAICDNFDAVATKAHDLAVTIAAAAELVDSINTTLTSLESDIEKVKADFPDYDLSYTEESVTYWKDIVAEFAAAPAEGKTPYTTEDIEMYAANFAYFQEEAANLYATAQQDEFMLKFYAVYMSADTQIGEMIETLETECPSVKDTYYSKLDDLRVELSDLYYSLYFDTVTQEEFDEMMKKVPEIVAQAKEILEEAKEAEKIATGINAVSADKVSADKVFTMDGKAVESVKGLKGAYIVNGKKVILK